MRRICVSFFIFVLVSLLVATGCQREKRQAEENKKINVEVSEVRLMDVSELITLTAQLRPYEEAMVIPKTPGLKVTKLSVKIGDAVEKNGILFELDKGIVRKQVEQAKLHYDTARENYQYQKQLIDRLQQQNIPVIQMRNVSGIQALPDEDSLRASLATANLQLEQTRIAYSTVLEQLQEMEYTSPIDGVITQLNIKENQMALQTAPAVVVSNIDRLKANLSVSATLLKELKLGQTVELELPDKDIKGIINLINPVADIRSNLYSVEAVFDNFDKCISPGAFYKLNLVKNHKEAVVVIPKEALVSEGEKSYVFVDNNGLAEKRYITKGVDGGKVLEIMEGLELGEMVVVRGQQFLEEGAEIIVRGDEDETN